MSGINTDFLKLDLFFLFSKHEGCSFSFRLGKMVVPNACEYMLDGNW